jgi:hypothetical protein
MNEIISYKICAVKVRNAKLRNYLNIHCQNSPPPLNTLLIPEPTARSAVPGVS